MFDVQEDHIDETNCPVRFTLDLLRGKWKPIILYYLKGGSVRYGELQRLIPHASQKVLTAQLRELERDRIVERTVYGGKIKHVEYRYSEHGRTLAPILGALADWGLKYRESYRKGIEIAATPVGHLPDTR